MHCIIVGPNKEAHVAASAKLTKKLYKEFHDMFTGVACFKGIFLLQIKEGAKPYETPPRCIKYTLQTPFRKEMECQHEQEMKVPLGVD